MFSICFECIRMNRKVKMFKHCRVVQYVTKGSLPSKGVRRIIAIGHLKLLVL